MGMFSWAVLAGAKTRTVGIPTIRGRHGNRPHPAWPPATLRAHIGCARRAGHTARPRMCRVEAIRADLAALFGRPVAGAHGLTLAAPGAGTGLAEQPAGAAGALAATAHRHPHGAVGANLAGHVEVALPGIGHAAVGDANRVAVGAVARTLVGNNQNAPGPIEVSSAGSGSGSRRNWGGNGKKGNKDATRGLSTHHQNLGRLLSRRLS